MDETKALIADLKNTFEAHADAEMALAMRKYMKNLFPFLGLKKPLRSELEKPFIAECKKLKFQDLEKIAKALWNLDAREYQYTAMVLLRSAKIWKHPESLELMEWLLLHKSWWDSVDAIAAQLVGPYFLKYPEKRDQKIAEWKKSDNMWLNRTTLIFQLKHKDKTDIDLLFNLIRHFAPQKEFFIKKAVGWALRQLSYTEPDLVVGFCNNHPLQPLSRREALKALERKGSL